MNDIDFNNCDEKALWIYVASHLNSRGISTVLVGGAVSAIYSHGAYRSGDLDLIAESQSQFEIDNALDEIGFKKQGKSYQHPECEHLFIEFISGPIATGNEVKMWSIEKGKAI